MILCNTIYEKTIENFIEKYENKIAVDIEQKMKGKNTMKNLNDYILDLSSGMFWAFVYEDSKNYIKLKFYKPDYTKRKAKSLFLKEVKDFLSCGDYNSINLNFPY